MHPYHKIQTLFKRIPESNNRALRFDDWSLPEFAYLAKSQWEFTEKLDGMNLRVTLRPGENPVFLGRTDNAQIPTFMFESLCDIFLLEKYPFDYELTLYGEGIGPKIQGGGKYTDKYDFVLFDVFCGGLWLKREDVDDIAKTLGCSRAAYFCSGNLYDLYEFVEGEIGSWYARDHGRRTTFEGVVARPLVELQTRRGERVITKLKVKDVRATEEWNAKQTTETN